MKLFVLDTSAIVGGFALGLSGAELVTTNEVLEESKATVTKMGIETAIMGGKVRVEKPSHESIQNVKIIAGKTGDRVSGTDVKLLALALDLKPSGAVLLTDDYAMQNLALALDIPYRQVVMPGIKKRFEWRAVCPACKRTYPASTKECSFCGSILKNKPRSIGFLKEE